MDQRKGIIGSCVALLLMAIAAWALGLFDGTDPAIAKLQEIGEQMSADNLPPAQRERLRDQFRQQMESMTDGQRRAFFDASRGQWEARAQQRMDEFFKLSKSDQQKRLDDVLNQMWRPRGNQRPGNGNRGGPRGANGSNGMTAAQRDERAKRRLDRTTPQMRAQYAEFRRMLGKRAEERGIKIGTDPRFGWRSS